MSSTEGEIPVPVEMGMINDPNTGHPDATFEIYDLGNVPAEKREHVIKTIEAVRTVRTSDDQMTRQAAASLARANLFRFNELTTDIPKSVQFVAVGEQQHYGVHVSYNNPYETPPTDHPVINSALRGLMDGDYLSLTVRRLTPPQK